jgi:hypothetical protein
MIDAERIKLLEETILLLINGVDIHCKPFDDRGLSENQQDILMKNIATLSIDSKRDEVNCDMEELIRRLKNTAYGIGYYSDDSEGHCYENARLLRKDTDEIIMYLNRYYEISKIVDEFNATRDSSSMVESAYAESTKIEKVECFDKILDIFKE